MVRFSALAVVYGISLPLMACAGGGSEYFGGVPEEGVSQGGADGASSLILSSASFTARAHLTGPVVLKQPGRRELGDTCQSQLQVPKFHSSLQYSRFLKGFSLATGDPFPSATADDSGALAAFASAPLVRIGGTLSVHIQTKNPELVLVDVLRMDGSTTGASIICSFQVNAAPQPAEAWADYKGQNYASFATWKETTKISIVDREHWLSGSYVVRVTDLDGKTILVPFVVEDDALPARALVVLPSLTQPVAYNLALTQRDTSASLYQGWDGKAYVQGKRVHAISVQRPLQSSLAGLYLSELSGAFQYLEQHGIPVTYTADLALWKHPELASKYSTLILPFHPEYASPEIYAAIEGAMDQGVHMMSWFSNGFYWKVEIGESSVGDTVLTINKDNYQDLWRNQLDAAGLSMSEQRLFYAEYPNRLGAWGGAATPFIVAPRAPGGLPSADLMQHWIFEGTGFQFGDQVENAMGGEVDVTEPNQPLPPTAEAVLFSSPYFNKSGQEYAASTVFLRRPSGQMTFHAGSQVFPGALVGPSLAHERLRRMVTNILERMVGAKNIASP